MTTYRAKRSTVALTLGFLTVLTLGTAVGVALAEPKWFFVALLVALGWEWYRHLRAPVAVSIEDDDSVEFRGVVGRTTVTPGEIRRVRRVGRYCILEAGDATINLYSNMDGLEEFIARLRAVNPELEVTRWGQKN